MGTRRRPPPCPASTGEYDLILLDVMLPGRDGYDICRQLRDKIDVPILMVTARTDSVDKIRGLGLGADDYIAKPFDPAELVARVKAHLSRYDRLVGDGRAQDVERITVGELTILPRSWKVYKGERELRLPNREFELLPTRGSSRRYGGRATASTVPERVEKAAKPLFRESSHGGRGSFSCEKVTLLP